MASTSGSITRFMPGFNITLKHTLFKISFAYELVRLRKPLFKALQEIAYREGFINPTNALIASRFLLYLKKPAQNMLRHSLNNHQQIFLIIVGLVAWRKCRFFYFVEVQHMMWKKEKAERKF